VLDAWSAAVAVAAFVGLARAVIRPRDLAEIWRNRPLSIARLALTIAVASWAIDGTKGSSASAASWTESALWLLWAPAFAGYFFAYWMDLSAPEGPEGAR
jgi:hypothetical protein